MVSPITPTWCHACHGTRLDAAQDRILVKHALHVFRSPDDVIEIRVIGALGHSGAGVGYFNDLEALVAEVAQYDGTAKGIYFNLNQLNPVLLPEEKNRIRFGVSA